jgi:glycosyltransferase involved in cell wall biosynthesis
MRVCFVSRRFFPAISGMSVYAANLLRELVAGGHEVTMVSQFRGDEAGTRVYGGGPPPPVPGVEVVGLEALGEQAGGDFERDVATLRDTVLAHGPFDVVHAQYGYPTGLAAMMAARSLGVPCVVSIQGGDGHWVGSCCPTHERAMRTVLDHAGALLIGSASFRDEVIGRFGTKASRFTIVPGAVDAERFSPGAPRSDGGGATLLYHGRVDRRKGALDLLDAMPRMRTPARLVMSGIGPDFDEARARARELGVDASFPGAAPYDEVPRVYADGDVFVSPTYAEGFSNTILEAMASGMPVVAGRAVGVVDCIDDERNGVLVEPGDVDGLARSLDALLADGARRERLARRAREDVERLYAWPVVARRIMAAYDAPVRTAWVDPAVTDEPCRFRAAPHLL